jgi:hypothetical protein
MANVCPSCGILNPPETPICDCGYDLTKSIESKVNVLDTRLAVAKEYFKWGILMFVSAVVIILLSLYAVSATGGGVIYIRYGAMIFGVIGLVFSIFEYIKVKDINKELKSDQGK